MLTGSEEVDETLPKWSPTPGNMDSDVAILADLQTGWNGLGSWPPHSCLLQLCWGALRVLEELGHESPKLYPYSDAETPSCALDVVWQYRDVYCELSLSPAALILERRQWANNGHLICEGACDIRAHMSWLHPGRHLLHRPRMYMVHSPHELVKVWLSWLSNSMPQFSSSV